MTASNLLNCFNETESFEGLDSNNPHDPGGATRKGVTQRVYTAFLLAHGRPAISVFEAPDADILAIYTAQFWNAVRGDDLFVGLDMMMVDSGWSSGPRQAILWLQRSLDIEDDGVFGLATMAAVNARWNDPALIDAVAERRMAFFRALPTWEYFGVGWTHRLNGVHQKALSMNALAGRSTGLAS